MPSPDTEAALRSILIVGAGGRMGSMLARQLAEAGLRVTLADRVRPDGSLPGAFVRAELEEPESLIELRDDDFDCVILAVPVRAAHAALRHLLPGPLAGSLLVDLLSEKSGFAEQVAERLPGTAHLGLHPLFGPGLAWEGRTVAATPRSLDDPRARALLAHIESWDVTVHRMDAGEHDRLMGVVQAGVHVALASYARFMVREGIDFELLDAVGTPPARTLWAMIARMLDNDAGVYAEIQRENPNAGDIRRRLVAAMEAVDEACEERGERAFDDLFREVAEMFGDRREEYAGLARELYQRGAI